MVCQFYREIDGDNVIDHLNKKYGVQSREDWINYIDDQVVEALQTNSPEIDFFSGMKDNTSDPDYIFRYTLHLIAVDGEMLFPGDSIILTEEIDFWDGVEYTDAEYDQVTAFHMTGGLLVNSPCVPNLRWIIEVNLVSDLELGGVITKLSQSFWRLSNIIEAHENRRLAPAREPEMEITYDKPFLSLLDEESRKMKVTVKVRNCKGQIVYYPVNSQPVYYEDHLDRFKLKNYKCGSQGYYKGHLVMLVYKELVTNGIYEVIKGLDPVEQKISIGTCGISTKSEMFTNGKIIVKGLEINVIPDKQQIHPDETANIIIRFSEVDPDGQKEPVSGKLLNINIKGLVDGDISPKGNYNTNNDGEVHLKYKAGENDKKITITANYQPVRYPDMVTGSGSVTVIPDKYEWTGRLTFEASQRFLCTHQTGYPIEENKFKEQIVDLRFSVEQISFQGMSPVATIGDIDGSGTIKITLDDQEEDIRTDYYRLEKWNAMNTFPLSGKNLVMTIQKKMKEDPETLRKRLEELAKTDPTKLIQEIQLMNTVEDKRHFEVDIYILITGDWLSDVTRLLKVDSKDKNTNDSKTEEQRIGTPMALRLTGDMSLDPDGEANITASSYETEYLPNGTIADFGCPPITSMWKFEMQLHKRKK